MKGRVVVVVRVVSTEKGTDIDMVWQRGRGLATPMGWCVCVCGGGGGRRGEGGRSACPVMEESWMRITWYDRTHSFIQLFIPHN